MNWNDYIQETCDNAKDYMRDDLVSNKYDSDFFEIFEDLKEADAVTGNYSGSCTYSADEAAENLTGVLWDDEVLERFKEAGYDEIPMSAGPEAIDVMVRIFALDECYSALEDYWDDELLQARTVEALYTETDLPLDAAEYAADNIIYGQEMESVQCYTGQMGWFETREEADKASEEYEDTEIYEDDSFNGAILLVVDGWLE